MYRCLNSNGACKISLVLQKGAEPLKRLALNQFYLYIFFGHLSEVAKTEEPLPGAYACIIGQKPRLI